MVCGFEVGFGGERETVTVAGGVVASPTSSPWVSGGVAVCTGWIEDEMEIASVCWTAVDFVEDMLMAV